jgi:hypothetical protein
MAEIESFRRCTTCRTPIPFEAAYWVCSVSTCNRPRTGLFFCSLPCWDAHLPEARHREAWAEERRAPTREAWAREQATTADGDDSAAAPVARRVVVTPAASPGAAPPPASPGNVPREILVVVSKLKAYIRARSGMNTSDGVVEALSDHLRRVCDEATRVAAADGRKTVMDRDFRAVFRS